MFRKFIFWTVFAPLFILFILVIGPWVFVYEISARFITGSEETKFIDYLDTELEKVGKWCRQWSRREDTDDWKILKAKDGDQ